MSKTCVVSLLMRSTLFFFIAIFLLLSAESCRKPDYSYYLPCKDTTLAKLYERQTILTADERVTFDSLTHECAKYNAMEENRGKLWLPILAAIGGIAAVILILVLAGGRPEQPGW
jgi:hypothetical protein